VEKAWMQVLVFRMQLPLWTISTMQNNENVTMPLSENLHSYSPLALNAYQVKKLVNKKFFTCSFS
jgi:hypothetical protein